MERVIYGKITMYRHFCAKCGAPNISNDGDYICDCGYNSTEKKWKRTKIEAVRPTCRRQPKAEIKREILEQQQGKCYWCNREFDLPYWRSSKIRYLKVNWDHKIPFAFEQRSRDNNWVASCEICNKSKYNHLFENDDECKEYVNNKWDNYLKRGEIVLAK